MYDYYLMVPRTCRPWGSKKELLSRRSPVIPAKAGTGLIKTARSATTKSLVADRRRSSGNTG